MNGHGPKGWGNGSPHPTFAQARWMNGAGSDHDVADFVNNALTPFYPDAQDITSSPFYAREEQRSIERPDLAQRGSR